MDSPKSPRSPKVLSHHNSMKSLRSVRSQKSMRSLKSQKSTQSIRIFNHHHDTYQTCFGFMHVKIATCSIGFFALLGVCFTLVYCVFTSQEQRRPNMKLYAIPMIIVIIALLYMFVGILQQKAHLLFAFIALQISVTFGIAVLIVIILISVACNTTFILKFFVDISLAQSEYTKTALTALVGLSFQLGIHIWALRAVCGCYRYFTDIHKFEVRQAQANYV
ncbi:MARVEL domain-containing protein [Caenorhabditis elegans]|uniref:MARVEL domain-containing protein n=1 Tax=Caenorhabditis elegans TaxID=6239 RepID=A5HU93_CAEEL|nr:MARVEL domain-containing protein [Caenorhabditis elegans]CCD69102.1 MARVEL domain-containing protein [Caenorhabditis elegans]|eukprot:NP_001123126.1 Uncharacterized protein CELE_F09F9.5 [Caenorhabditis elegans]